MDTGTASAPLVVRGALPPHPIAASLSAPAGDTAVLPRAETFAKEDDAMAKPTAVSLRERVKAPPAQVMVDAYYAPSLENALKYTMDAELRIHLAHGLMLVRQGIVARGDMARILALLLELQRVGPAVLAIDYTQEDLYSYVERHLVTKLGAEVGGRLHTGRSRNDLHTTSWRMALRERLLVVAGVLLDLRATVLEMAGAHTETVMPGYTHSQHAQPITLGYYLLSLGDLLGRDFVRLHAALAQTDRCTLGAGALATTGFPIDRNFTAERLGFAGLAEVAYDGVSVRDDAHEAVAALAILATNLSRLAFDLQNWNTMEYGFIELGDAYASVSSIMPQKKNPQSLEHSKAAAAHVVGDLMTALACSKNTSLSDVNDGVSAVNAPVLEATERTEALLRMLGGVLRTLRVHPETMRRSAEIGFGTATELADVIVRETGLSFRMAHNIVGTVVRRMLAAGKIATDIGAGDLERACRELFGKPLGIAPAAVAEALDPRLNVRVRTVGGGPAPRNVRRMLAQRRRRLDKDRARVASFRARLTRATGRLLREARRAAKAS